MELIPNLAELGGLNCVYFALLAVGVLYALVVLVGGGMHDFGVAMDVPGDIGAGVDVLHGDVDLISLSPITIAGFVTAFGAFGLIATGLAGASAPASIAWAAIGGVVVGLLSHIAFIYVFIKPQGSSEVTRRDLIGVTAEVVTPIPPGSVGEIALVAQGARISMTARAVSGEAIARGQPVRIEDIVGSVCYVVPRTASEPPPS